MKRMKITFAFDMEYSMLDDQTPEEIANSYSYMLGLGKNWRVVKSEMIDDGDW